MFAKADYFYTLPQTKIAKHPLNVRSQSKLLVVNGIDSLIDSQFINLVDFIEEGDLLIFNNTKVIPARIFAKQENGVNSGEIEIFIEQILTETTAYARCRLGRLKKNPEGVKLYIDSHKIEIIKKQDEGYLIKSLTPLAEIVNKYGKMPIPPYLERKAQECDKKDYQTIFAKNEGAVAAPTAGLHFDEELFYRIAHKNINIAEISLHVGAGTFLPLREDDIRKHKIHREHFSVAQSVVDKIIATKKQNKKVIAVGTTSLRALESLAQYQNIKNINLLKPDSRWTEIYITPDFEFKIVDRLITNFHQPTSTLLILVSAFAGFELIQNVYKYALNNNYRFLSYGDGMILDCLSIR